MEDKRTIARVLVMLDYGPQDPQSGEVFDLTALVKEIASRPGSKHQYANIELKVQATNDYSKDKVNGAWPLKLEAGWRATIDYERTGLAAFLDDAINSGMPDSFTTTEMRKKLRKIQNKAEKISGDILIQRLRDAAAIRSTHPIARVNETPILNQIAEAKP